MSVTTTSPEGVWRIKGSRIYLDIKSEESGEPERAEFRVKEFCHTRGGLQVELWSKDHDKIFKLTITDPEEVVSDHKMSFECISDALKQILRNNVDNVTTSLKDTNGESVLQIKVPVESKVFNTEVIYDFTYKFPSVEISDHERLEIKVLELENIVAEIKLEIEEISREAGALIPVNAKVIAQFDVSRNNHTSLSNNGRAIEHITGGGVYNTTPLNFEMKNRKAYRARFRVGSQAEYFMVGVINRSFCQYQNYPANGQNGWVASFHPGNLKKSHQHNGSFKIYSNGPAPLKGSIVTVEVCTKEGWIQYFVNGTPAGLHKECSFGSATRFAVVLSKLKDKVELLSLERLQDDF